MPDWLGLLASAVIASGVGWITVRGAKRLTAAQASKTDQERGGIQDKRIAELQEQVAELWEDRGRALKTAQEEEMKREKLEECVNTLLKKVEKLKQSIEARDKVIEELNAERAQCLERIAHLEMLLNGEVHDGS